MVKCKICGKEFHACSNCGLDSYWEYDYCSITCWRQSKEYIDARLDIEIALIKLQCKLEDLMFDEDVLNDMIELKNA